MTILHGYRGLLFLTLIGILRWNLSLVGQAGQSSLRDSVSSVPAERGFSLQSRIKTAQRSRLGEGTGLLYARRELQKDTFFTIILIQVSTW